jgi:DNA-binding NtrC family response regulator
MDRNERDAKAGFGGLIGRSAGVRQLFAEAERAAAGSHPVSIVGEAGTGKHVLARALHHASPVAAGPFIVLDCAMPHELLESELFGRHEGAQGGRAGALERAHGGSLLLDDVSELSLGLQARLEQTLTTSSVVPAAGDPVAPRALRLIATSRRRLSADVEREKFLAALATRLSSDVLVVPPLRDRRDDVPALAQHLLAQMEEARGLSLSAAALEALALHDWPGNVRELRNVLERWLYALRTGSAEARRLSALLLTSELPAVERRASAPEGFEPDLSYRAQRARFEADFERRYVAWLLERHDGNVSAAARAAEMDRKYLYKLARKHALKPAT